MLAFQTTGQTARSDCLVSSNHCSLSDGNKHLPTNIHPAHLHALLPFVPVASALVSRSEEAWLDWISDP
jgi:hypothetical protein